MRERPVRSTLTRIQRIGVFIQGGGGSGLTLTPPLCDPYRVGPGKDRFPGALPPATLSLPFGEAEETKLTRLAFHSLALVLGRIRPCSLILTLMPPHPAVG